MHTGSREHSGDAHRFKRTQLRWTQVQENTVEMDTGSREHSGDAHRFKRTQ